MVKEVESRNKLFAEAGVDSIDEYNKIVKKKMSKIWIVIEEISIFMSDFTDSKEEAKAKDVCFNLVFRLVRTARSSGIGILSVLQRLTVDNIGGNGSIKSLCSIITFKQNNDISSRVAIDSDLATELNQDDIRKYKPDIFVMCEDATKKGESFTSAPKLIFEILSKSTAKFDKGRKYDTYEKFGVLEYNLVEQTGFIVQHKLIDGAYQIVNVYKNNDEYESVVFPDLKISLNDIFE